MQTFFLWLTHPASAAAIGAASRARLKGTAIGNACTHKYCLLRSPFHSAFCRPLRRADFICFLFLHLHGLPSRPARALGGPSLCIFSQFSPFPLLRRRQFIIYRLSPRFESCADSSIFSPRPSVLFISPVSSIRLIVIRFGSISLTDLAFSPPNGRRDRKKCRDERVPGNGKSIFLRL